MEQDIIGRKFGRLTVVEKSDKVRRGEHYYKCKCECGNIVYETAPLLKNNHTKSCGCLRIDAVKKSREKIHFEGSNINSFINDKPNKNNKTGYKGIQEYKVKNGVKYRVILTVSGKRYSKKGFDTVEEAYAYREELKRLHVEPLIKKYREQKNNPS